MTVFARLVNLASGALAFRSAPQTPVPPEVERETATGTSGVYTGLPSSFAVSQGLEPGSLASVQLPKQPAVVLQAPVRIATTSSTAHPERVFPSGVESNGIKSLSMLLSASAMTFLTGCDGSDVLWSLVVGGAAAAYGRTWWKSHTVKKLEEQELTAQQNLVAEAISVLENPEMHAKYFSQNPHKALEAVTALKKEIEELHRNQTQEEKEMRDLKTMAEKELDKMRNTTADDGKRTHYEARPDLVRRWTDIMATCDAVLEDADGSTLGKLDNLLTIEIPPLVAAIEELVRLRAAELKNLQTEQEQSLAIEEGFRHVFDTQARLANSMAERARVATDLALEVRGLQDRVDEARAWHELGLIGRLGRFFPKGSPVNPDLSNPPQRGEVLEAEIAPQAEAMREARPAHTDSAQALQLSGRRRAGS